MATRKEARIYPLTNWQQAVADGSTNLGYRAWVKANVGKIERVELDQPCTESIFASIVRKLNDRGVTLRREGEVDHPDGTVTFKDDAALLYTDGDVEYRVVKTARGYVVWNGIERVAWGDHEEHVDIIVDDIYHAVAK